MFVKILLEKIDLIINAYYRLTQNKKNIFNVTLEEKKVLN